MRYYRDYEAGGAQEGVVSIRHGGCGGEAEAILDPSGQRLAGLEALNRAWHGDRVRVSDDGRVTEILETARRSERIVGVLHLDDKQKYGLNSKGAPIYLFRPLASHYPPMMVASSVSSTHASVYVIASYLEWGVEQRYPRGQCEAVLGASGDPSADALARAHLHGLMPSGRPPGAWRKLPHVELPAVPPAHLPPIFSIDPVGCKDIDDAISVASLGDDTYEVGVYIADVTAFFGEGSELDREAGRRAYTVYLPDGKQVPILPEELALNRCSLLPGQVRPAAAFLARFRGDGAMCGEPRFERVVIRSGHALAYDDVDARRVPRELRPSLDILESLFGRGKRDSHKLIETLMLLANTHAARALLRREGSPVLLRRQTASYSSSDKGGDNTWLSRMQSAHGAPAEYVLCSRATPVEETRHASLGVDAYTHFTSPIRRYADQVVHRLLFSHGTIGEDTVAHLNRQQQKHRRFQRDRAILDYVHACNGGNPETHMGIILPMRTSQWGPKIDIAIPSIELVYPMRVFNPRKLGGVFQVEALGEGELTITNRHSGASVTLRVGQEIPVTLHVRAEEPVLHDKCTLTSDALACLYE